MDDAAIKFIDKLENHPLTYLRQKILVTMDTGETCETWTYTLTDYKPELLNNVMYESFGDGGETGQVCHHPEILDKITEIHDNIIKDVKS